MEMVQVQFEKGRAERLTGLLVWVDASWNLKPGNVVEFVDKEGFWLVKKVYTQRVRAENLNKKWGLDLPKSQRTER